MHAAVAVALYKERPYQLERAEQQWDVSQVRAVVDEGLGLRSGFGSDYM